jgi:ceramide glucosyltransferase
MTTCLWLVCTLVAIIGSVYAVLAGVLTSKFAGQSLPPLQTAEDVTLLKPLYGAETELEQNLASFCAQDYAADVELVCGVQDPADPAIGVVQNLRTQFPNRTIKLAVAPSRSGGNPKISNILSMFPLALHDVIVLSDSDMRVDRNYVRDVVATLQQPEVGLVTCLYRGHAVGGIWSRLAAAAVDHHFLPSVLVGLRFGLAQPCFGSTIALRRETLKRIGGFESVADTLADDYAIGDAVRGLGLKIAIPPFTVDHTFSERTLSEFLAHELRWARTIRLVDPKGYAGSIVTHPLPFAIVALLLSGFSAIGLIILATTLACRVFVPIQVERLPGGGQSSVWLSPLRDLLSFAVFVASFVPGAVDWRGRRYRVGSDGSVTPV